MVLFLIVVKKRKLAFLIGDTYAESNNINTAAAVLGKPFICMSSPQKRKGVLKQKGETGREEIAWEKRDQSRPQQPRAAFNLTSAGN